MSELNNFCKMYAKRLERLRFVPLGTIRQMQICNDVEEFNLIDEADKQTDGKEDKTLPPELNRRFDVLFKERQKLNDEIKLRERYGWKHIFVRRI